MSLLQYIKDLFTSKQEQTEAPSDRVVIKLHNPDNYFTTYAYSFSTNEYQVILSSSGFVTIKKKIPDAHRKSYSTIGFVQYCPEQKSLSFVPNDYILHIFSMMGITLDTLTQHHDMLEPLEQIRKAQEKREHHELMKAWCPAGLKESE